MRHTSLFLWMLSHARNLISQISLSILLAESNIVPWVSVYWRGRVSFDKETDLLVALENFAWNAGGMPLPASVVNAGVVVEGVSVFERFRNLDRR